MIRDRRPRIFAAIMNSQDLSYRERCYLFAVTALDAEHVDGKVRPGSKGMDRQGRFSLHLDYIARGMGGTVPAAREARRSLEKKHWLDKIHGGTYGRPDAYQVLLVQKIEAVRVRNYYTLTDTQNPHPYDGEELSTRVRETRTLDLRGGAQPSHVGSGQSQHRWDTDEAHALSAHVESIDLASPAARATFLHSADGVGFGIDDSNSKSNPPATHLRVVNG